ncbi:MAG TPA: head-tail connector protein [Methanocella sp.]|jgi:uncharacterized phiE125 gp8 family phage protein
MASKDLYNLLDKGIALNPQNVTSATTINGVTINIGGYNAVAFSVMSGSVSNGTFSFKLQHGMLSDGSDMADVASTDLIGSFVSWTNADSYKIQRVGYQGNKNYVRLVSTTTGGTVGGLITADVELGYRRFSIRLVTPAATEPVSLADAKKHLNVEHTDDDPYITDLIVAARERAEGYANMAFITQTWDLIMDVPGKCIDLPRYPLQSVTGVYVISDSGVETAVDTNIYRVDPVSAPGRVFLKQGQSWPARADTAGFKVRYVAGYASASAVPLSIRQAIKETVAHWYENRSSQEMPDGANELLDIFKVEM